ncbi:MAG: ATP-binding cassette domain-containing protein [Acidimicrobiales bacterium]
MVAFEAKVDSSLLKGGGLNVDPLLQIQDLTVRYGQLLALDGAALAIQPGQLVALAGENGVGKTTLIRCIAGDINVETGNILFDGQPIGCDPPIELREVGVGSGVGSGHERAGHRTYRRIKEMTGGPSPAQRGLLEHPSPSCSRFVTVCSAHTRMPLTNYLRNSRNVNGMLTNLGV